jgi:hypothetical protein
MKKFTKRRNESRITTKELKRHTFSKDNEVGEILVNNIFTKPEKEDSTSYKGTLTVDGEIKCSIDVGDVEQFVSIPDVKQKVLGLNRLSAWYIIGYLLSN